MNLNVWEMIVPPEIPTKQTQSKNEKLYQMVKSNPPIKQIGKNTMKRQSAI